MHRGETVSFLKNAERPVHHAGNNEIDNGLLDLLQQNIDAANAAGQPEPAQFMEKVRDAAKKFVMS